MSSLSGSRSLKIKKEVFSRHRGKDTASSWRRT
jgi:hypothetical protein